MTRQVSKRGGYIQVGADIRKPSAKLGITLGTILFFLVGGIGVAVHIHWLIFAAAVVSVVAWWLIPRREE